MQQILLIRHGIALDREKAMQQKITDRERDLTDDGARKTRQAFDGLTKLIESIDLILTSPYNRAAQTATILAKRFPGAKVQNESILQPGGDPTAIADWLGTKAGPNIIALVGHEPGLSQLASVLLLKQPASFIRLKKAGVIIITRAADHYQMEGLYTPKCLRNRK
jgi:phosphohistidine phosphatase